MKRRSNAPAKLAYRAALRRMFRGATLVRTNREKRAVFDISPGGPVDNATAERLLRHNLIKPADLGLLADRPQSWKFQVSIVSDT